MIHRPSGGGACSALLLGLCLVPKADLFIALSVSKSLIFRIGISDLVLVDTRYDKNNILTAKLDLPATFANFEVIGVPVLF